MKINRNQDVHQVPSWVTAGTHIEEIEKNQRILQKGIDRINATASNKVTDLTLIEERNHIEKCASNNSTYYYNKTWTTAQIDHLKEYAHICGVKDLVGVDPTGMQRSAHVEQPIVKTANVETELERSLKNVLGDPFKLDERTDMSHMEQADWEQISPESKMDYRNINVAMNGGILPLRGGEDYTKANQRPLARNENSIADPYALDRLYESDYKTAGEKLKDNNRRTQEQKHQEWISEKLAGLNGYEAKGTVFPTEVGNVGSGISSNFMGAYSEADLKNLPEKTAGEKIREANENRKRSIQREAKSDKDWDQLKPQNSVRVSDLFTEELKKHLGK